MSAVYRRLAALSELHYCGDGIKSEGKIMAQSQIAAWAAGLKESKLLQKNNSAWIHVGGTDSSILEIRLGPIYTRIVWSARNPSYAPYAFWSFVSDEYPDYPKSDFFGTTIKPEFFTVEQVLDYFCKRLPLEASWCGLGYRDAEIVLTPEGLLKAN
jgi:hypothetical protein